MDKERELERPVSERDRENREYYIKALIEESARLSSEGKTVESCEKFSEAINLAMRTY